MEERELISWLTNGMVVCAAISFVALASGAQAYYGRYAKQAPGWMGKPMNARVAWILQVSD